MELILQMFLQNIQINTSYVSTEAKQVFIHGSRPQGELLVFFKVIMVHLRTFGGFLHAGMSDHMRPSIN